MEDGEKVPVDPSTYGQFFGGDCYLILYTYRVEAAEKYIIYIWWGFVSPLMTWSRGSPTFWTIGLIHESWELWGAARMTNLLRYEYKFQLGWLMCFYRLCFFSKRQGQKCSQQELGASALLAVALDDSLGQKPTQVKLKKKNKQN